METCRKQDVKALKSTDLAAASLQVELHASEIQELAEQVGMIMKGDRMWL